MMCSKPWRIIRLASRSANRNLARTSTLASPGTCSITGRVSAVCTAIHNASGDFDASRKLNARLSRCSGSMRATIRACGSTCPVFANERGLARRRSVNVRCSERYAADILMIVRCTGKLFCNLRVYRRFPTLAGSPCFSSGNHVHVSRCCQTQVGLHEPGENNVEHATLNTLVGGTAIRRQIGSLRQSPPSRHTRG